MEAAARQVELEARAERNRQLREEESKFEKPNPLELYLEMLAATEEATIAKEGFTAMGSSSDVPKLFKCNGKVPPPPSPLTGLYFWRGRSSSSRGELQDRGLPPQRCELSSGKADFTGSWV